MAQYLTPGVYVEEKSSGSVPIAGVSTSVAGFIGQVLAEGESGPIAMPPIPGKFDENGAPLSYPLAKPNEPEFLTNWNEFKVKFGDGIQDHNRTLAHALYGFFNNGGTRCWVVRVEEVTLDTVAAALERFEAIDEISLVAVPGAVSNDIQNAVVDHCLKLQDRFAILDGQRTSVYTPEAIRGSDLRDSNYAGLYYPWFTVPRPGATQPDALDYVPPSGHVAGIYARSDSSRGVHKAPANEAVRGIRDVEFRLAKSHQESLNPKGVNVIRRFNGNILVWGARTLDGEGEWKYINVRRLFLFLRESIEESMGWCVFEPNAPDLWAKITRNITAFLMVQWRAGALFGATPEQAFYVKCNAETNPQEIIDLGQVVTEIGVAPVKPAEFVIFRIQQWAGPGS